MTIATLKAALQALQEAEAGLEFAGADKPHDGDFVPTPKLALQKVRSAISLTTVEIELAAGYAALFTQCRIELVTAVHDLTSHFENALGAFGRDQEARRKAEGDIAHALKVAARWNWNGRTTAQPAKPPAPIAGVTAIYCGWGCKCVTQCGDTYDYTGQPKPPLKPATPAQPPAAQPVTTFEPWHLLKHRILPPGTAPTSSLHWGDEQAAAPSVEAEPVAPELFELTRSIIHACPAIKLPQSLVEQLGMTAQIVALKGADDAIAERIVHALNAAPLQQPQEGWVSVPREPVYGPEYEAGNWSRRNYEAYMRDQSAAAPSQGEGEG